MKDFLAEVIAQLPPKARVLDLGAGEGKYSRQFIAHKAREVVAVDHLEFTSVDPGIKRVRAKVGHYVEKLPDTEFFDVVFLRNILQFLETKYVLGTLLEKLKAHTAPRGIIAVATFNKPPVPPFSAANHTYYHLADLSPLFNHWQMLLGREFERIGPDMSGEERKFFLTELIVRHP